LHPDSNLATTNQSSIQPNGPSIYLTLLLPLALDAGWTQQQREADCVVDIPGGCLRNPSLRVFFFLFYEILLDPGIESAKQFLGLELQSTFRAF